jgi:hypothetical protein
MVTAEPPLALSASAWQNTKKVRRQRNGTQVLPQVHVAEDVLIGIENFAKKRKKKMMKVKVGVSQKPGHKKRRGIRNTH